MESRRKVKSIFINFPEGTRHRGSSRSSWSNSLLRDIRSWERMTQDRDQCTSAVEEASARISCCAKEEEDIQDLIKKVMHNFITNKVLSCHKI